MSELSPNRRCGELVAGWIAQGKRVVGRAQCRRERPAAACSTRLLESADQLLLEGFVRPANSIKEFFFPQARRALRLPDPGKGIELIEVEPPRSASSCIIAARPCDAAALPILDQVFNWDYRGRVLQPPPRSTTIVTLACTAHDDALLLHLGRPCARTTSAARTRCCSTWATASTKCAA